MGLLFDVSIDFDSIAKAAWTRAVANRERTKRRLDTQEEKKKKKKDASREKYITPKPELYRPDEPVAHAKIPRLNLGHAWMFYKYPTPNIVPGVALISQVGYPRSSAVFNFNLSQSRPILIGCGNGSDWESFTTGASIPPPPTNADYTDHKEGPYRYLQYTNDPDNFYLFQYQYRGLRTVLANNNYDQRAGRIVLPAGDGNFVIVLHQACAWYGVVESSYWSTKLTYTENGSISAPSDPNRVADLLDGPPFNYMYADYFDYAFTHGTSSDSPYTSAPFVNSGVVGVTSYYDSRTSYAAYVCNNSKIREISLPPSIQKLVNAANAIEFEESTYLTRGHEYTYTKFKELPNAIQIGGGGGFDGTWNSVTTPSVFEALNNILNFVASDQIKQTPSNLNWGLIDTSVGGYKRFQNADTVTYPYWSSAYEEGIPFSHAVWRVAGQAPDLRVYDPTQAGLRLPPPRGVPRADLRMDPDRPSRAGPYEVEELITVYDWGNPGYCRSMMAALGFSGADLVP